MTALRSRLGLDAPTILRCTDRHGGDVCEREAGHDGLHRAGEHTWAFVDPFVPEWIRRSRLRPLGLARDETGRVSL